MVTLLYSDAEYNAFYANLRRNVRLARKTVKSVRNNRKSLRKARRSLLKALKIRDSFRSISGQFVCEIKGMSEGEFNLRNSIAVRKNDAYRTFLEDNDRVKYDQKNSELSSELAHSIGLGFPDGNIFPLPLYLGTQSEPSSGKWLSLYGKSGTQSVGSLGEVRIEDLGDNTKRVVVSSDIMNRSDIFFLASERFSGDLTKLRVISMGASRMSKVANGYMVGEFSLGGEYKTPCYCTDCPGTNINSNCSSGCCTTPD